MVRMFVLTQFGDKHKTIFVFPLDFGFSSLIPAPPERSQNGVCVPGGWDSVFVSESFGTA